MAIILLNGFLNDITLWIDIVLLCDSLSLLSR